MKKYRNHLMAESGMVLRRKGTDDIYGSDIYLGYSYFISGIKQDPPHLDVPEDFEEIPEPEDMIPLEGEEN